jgi:hypothetical protein
MGISALFRTFFEGLVKGLRADLYIRASGADGDDGIVDSIFRSFGRALREAVTPAGGAAPVALLNGFETRTEGEGGEEEGSPVQCLKRFGLDNRLLVNPPL